LTRHDVETDAENPQLVVSKRLKDVKGTFCSLIDELGTLFLNVF
jgi:hypothetical protein